MKGFVAYMNVKKYKMLSLCFGVFLLLFSGCSSKENPFPDHEGGKIFLGLKDVNISCSECHGDLGGGGMSGPSLVKSVKNLTPEQFVAVVISGRGNMPAFNKKLQEEEILQITEWLKMLP